MSAFASCRNGSPRNKGCGSNVLGGAIVPVPPGGNAGVVPAGAEGSIKPLARLGKSWLRPSLRSVTDGLDIVTVGIEHERAVIVRMVMRPKPGRAVVFAAGSQRRA